MNPDQQRFMSYVSKQADGCWLWTGAKAITGYAIFGYKSKTWLAHRASLVVFKKVEQLTPGLQVSHSCRNRHCVNPDHLSQKTRSENNGPDKIAHGVSLAGDRCHFSKLDWTKVSEIRASEKKIKELATDYGISKSAISNVLRQRTWKINQE